MKYLLTGGGTGGHVYPALAIANEIRQTRADAEFLYVGHRDKLDAWVVPEQGYPIRFVRASPFPRTRSLVALLRFACTLLVGVVQGWSHPLALPASTDHRHGWLRQRADPLRAWSVG